MTPESPPSQGAQPVAFEAARAQRTFEALASSGFIPEEQDRALLTAAFGNSPFLSRLAIREHGVLRDILRQPADVVARAGARALLAANAESAERAMSALRVAKRQAALTVALADISRNWDVDRVTLALSQFADCCVQGALRF